MLNQFTLSFKYITWSETFILNSSYMFFEGPDNSFSFFCLNQKGQP